MYCAKLTLIDRRHNAVRKSKHATSSDAVATAGFKRNCLIKECEFECPSRTPSMLPRIPRNRYSSEEDGHEDDYNPDGDALISWDTSSSTRIRVQRQTTTSIGSSNRLRSGRQTISMPHPKTPLTITTLDMPSDVKGHHGTTSPVVSQRDPRTFRVPHNYQQYQQTILNRSLTTFADHGDKAPTSSSDICVRGEKIEGQSKPPGDDVSRKMSLDMEQEHENGENYQMMNAYGETNINFYDFQRTWSIEDYEYDEDEDEGSVSSRRMSFGDTSNDQVTNKSLPGRYNRRIIRPPSSPKTKQIIRVNVKVANS